MAADEKHTPRIKITSDGTTVGSRVFVLDDDGAAVAEISPLVQRLVITIDGGEAAAEVRANLTVDEVHLDDGTAHWLGLGRVPDQLLEAELEARRRREGRT